MANHVVTMVREERSDDGTHEHVEGFCTDGGVHYTRREVVDSINAGNIWKTSAGGYEATIEPIKYCPRGACLASPTSAPTPTAPARTTSRTSTAAERLARAAVARTRVAAAAPAAALTAGGSVSTGTISPKA